MNKKMMRKMLKEGREAARKAAWEFATGKKTWEELHLISEQLRDLAAEYDTMKGYTEYLLCREREEQYETKGLLSHSSLLGVHCRPCGMEV